MSVINTNITSMIAQQNLNDSKGALETNMERLSSGLRINSAKDDAAGQAIANRFEAQTTGLGQAQRNASDGISVAQTAEGALDQVNDNVQRIRELSVQAANGTNSKQDLGSIQDEINQRTAEIDRISEQTDFNGVKVLDKGAGKESLDIQVGANDGETISINLETINKDTLGLDDFNVQQMEKPSAATTSISSSTLSSGDTASLAGIEFDVIASGDTAESGTMQIASNATLTASYSGSGGSTTLAASNLVSTEGGDFYQKVGSGADAEFYEVEANPVEATNSGTDATVNFAIKDGSAATPVDKGTVGITDSSAEVTEANETAKAGLETLDNALAKVDGLRSDLGAIQNRFESAITNLSTNETNLSDAQSRIEDADYASEVADMTKNQILQQAGTSVLAQANQLPQNALSLLG